MSVQTKTIETSAEGLVGSKATEIETVFKQKLNINEDVQHLNQQLFSAIKEGLFVECFRLLENENVDVNYVDENVFTALLTATAFNHIDIVELLISKGANLFLETENQITPIQMAGMLQNTPLQWYFFEQVMRSGNKTNIMSTIIGYNYEPIFDIFIEICSKHPTSGVNKLCTVIRNYLGIVAAMKEQNGMPPKINNAFVDSVLIKIARNDLKLLSYFDTTFSDFVKNVNFTTLLKLTSEAYVASNASKTAPNVASSSVVVGESDTTTSSKAKKLNGRQRKALKAKQEAEQTVESVM